MAIVGVRTASDVQQAPEPREPVDVPEDRPIGPPTATIRGRVIFLGTPPENRVVNVTGECAALHEKPLTLETYVVGAEGGLKNVVVWVSRGLPRRTWPVPSEPVVIDPRGCVFRPHVVALQTRQKLTVLNRDAHGDHAVHFMPLKNREYNGNRIGWRGRPSGRIFRESEPRPVRIKCDVHPWMSAYVGVFDHPYFAVTDENGRFELPKIAAATYVLTAWHERLGTQTVEITVADGETRNAPRIEFEAPDR